MPKKRKSAESKNDGPTTGGSESLSHEEDNAKRVELDLLSNTTLQDLPTELLECILVKVVAMEVVGMKLAKRVWKEKVDLVISRLSTVCSQWSSILATKSFRTKLHRILDGTGQEFRLEIAHESTIPFDSRAITSLGDETFLLCEHRLERFKPKYSINVYNSSNNMEEAKQIIPLPGKDPRFITGCSTSNCVFLTLRQRNLCSLSILRLSKDAGNQYSISPWKSDHRRTIAMMSVTASGSLMILDGYNKAISIYNANGSLQHQVKLPPVLDVHRYVNILQKSNGNVVFAYVSDINYLTQLLEIDTNGIVVRRFESAYSEESCATFADIHDRILISPPFRKFELLDSELNLIGVYSLQQDVGKNICLFDWHFDSERNEVVRIHRDRINMINVLTKYRLTEE